MNVGNQGKVIHLCGSESVPGAKLFSLIVFNFGFVVKLVSMNKHSLRFELNESADMYFTIF